MATEGRPQVVGTIRVMVDGDGLPLWDDEGRLRDDDDVVHGVLGLAPDLTAALREWCAAVEYPAHDADINELILRGALLTLRLSDALPEHTVLYAPPRLSRYQRHR